MPPTLKRALCVLLSMVLGLMLLIPAAAANEATDPYAPIIMKQPNQPMNEKFVQAGKNLKLEVQAQLPEGIVGTLSYAWYDFNWQPGSLAQPVATDAKAVIPTTKNMLTDYNADAYEKMKGGFATTYKYCVVVTNTYVDAEGQEQAVSVKSDLVEVNLFAGLGTALVGIWTRSSLLMTLLTIPFPILLTLLYTLFSYPLTSILALM